VAAARNHALARASGEYVSFLDSDDRWMPEKLEQVAALIGRDSQADLIYHDVMFMARDGRRWRDSSGPPPSDPYRRLLLGSNFLATTSVTVRRSCVATAGGFDCNPDFEICEDYELWLRLARAGAKFAYIPATLAEIVRMDGSLSSNVTRHMRNRLNVRRHCLKQARDEGILSPVEFKRHGYRVAARCYAAIAADQTRQWHLIGALRAAGAAAGACFRIVLGGDWEMVLQLARAALRRLIRQLRSSRDSH
jgi:glycosyltransferase involved in cell wall biosynthesis